MSTMSADPRLEVCSGAAASGPVRELLRSRAVPLGESTQVLRLLPTLRRRMVGAWCFVDHYGPDDIADRPGMQVPPHPHTGLQTVSWLIEGEVHHRDSLGSDVLVAPGALALMTAGEGIAHAEVSPHGHSPVLHGAQLWVALPDDARAVAPRFEHVDTLPVLTGAGWRATVLLGEAAQARSPGRVHSPIVGLDVALASAGDARVPVEPDFEHAVLTVSGAPEVDGGALTPGSLCYLGTGRRELRLRAPDGARLLLLGGVPFAEQIVMWWNFVARTGQEIADARQRWADGGFGAVTGAGTALTAPALPPTPLRPRGRIR